MVDLNNQLLKLSFEEAQEEIAHLISMGYTDLILTFPILEDGNYEIEEMISKFNMFKLNFKGINLYLGNEIHYHYSLIHRLKKNDILSLNQSKYILLKLPMDKKPDQFKQLINALHDYKIIISCVEQYKYFKLRDLVELKKLDILYLVNIKNIRKHKVKQLLKKQLVDYLVTYDDINDHIYNLKKMINQNYYRNLTKDNYDAIIKNTLVK